MVKCQIFYHLGLHFSAAGEAPETLHFRALSKVISLPGIPFQGSEVAINDLQELGISENEEVIQIIFAEGSKYPSVMIAGNHFDANAPDEVEAMQNVIKDLEELGWVVEPDMDFSLDDEES